MDVKPLLNLVSDRLRAMPLVVLYITDGCNSRCISCDIWKLPRRNMDIALVERLADDFRALGVRRVVLSGGEAMQHPEWPRIARIFHDAGAQVWLLTNGLALKKQAQAVIDSLDLVTVSLDGATPETYHAIRGVDALPVILEGMKAVSAGGVSVTTRTTIQQGNFREMAQIVDVAKEAGAQQVSFLAVDVGSAIAFGPRFGEGNTAVQSIPMAPNPALSQDNLAEFAAVLDSLERSHAADFESKRIAESPAKLRRLYNYFAAINGLRDFEPPRCNAPHISTVINVDGKVQPCFFLPVASDLNDRSLSDAINSPKAMALRKAYRSGERQECARCVCPLFRGPRALLRE